MPYKLLVTDLDGTLLGPGHQLEPRMIRACRQLQEAGCLVTFATGRMWQATLPLAHELAIDIPVIAFQGALAQHRHEPSPLWHDVIPLDAAGEILEWLAHQGAVASVCHGDELILSHPVPQTLRFFEAVGIRPRVAPQLHRELVTAPSRIAVYGAPDEVDGWVERLQAAFPSGLRIGRTLQNLLEVTHERASKGQAIERLATELGIDISEVVACGDNYNDADMLATAGLGVAMGEAPDAIKQMAGRVVDRQVGGGLAGFFEELAAQLRG